MAMSDRSWGFLTGLEQVRTWDTELLQGLPGLIQAWKSCGFCPSPQHADQQPVFGIVGLALALGSFPCAGPATGLCRGPSQAGHPEHARECQVCQALSSSLLLPEGSQRALPHTPPPRPSCPGPLLFLWSEPCIELCSSVSSAGKREPVCVGLGAGAFQSFSFSTPCQPVSR